MEKERFNVICLDAGQTSTKLFLLNEQKEIILSRGFSPILHFAKKNALSHFKTILKQIFQKIRQMSKQSDLYIVMSLSGFYTEDQEVKKQIIEYVKQINNRIKNVEVFPDTYAHWYVANRGAPSILVINGGGSVVFGKNGNDEIKIDGWGHALGDEGSSFWIGLQAIKLYLYDKATNRTNTEIRDKIETTFSISSEYEMLTRYYSGKVTDQHISNIAKEIIQLAYRGDKEAKEIVNQSIQLLTNNVSKALKTIGKLPVFLSGGVFQSDYYYEQFVRILDHKDTRRLIYDEEHFVKKLFDLALP